VTGPNPMDLELMPPSVDHVEGSIIAIPTPSNRLVSLNGPMTPLTG